MITVRPEIPDDLEAIRAVQIGAYPTTAEARLVDLLRAAGRLTVSLVALGEGEVIGHVGFSPVTVSTGAVGIGLAPVAVFESYRCQGVAARMIEAGLAIARTVGYGWAVVLGSPHYYGRFGFRPASAFCLSDEYSGGDAFQALELVPGLLPAGAKLVKYATEFSSLG